MAVKRIRFSLDTPAAPEKVLAAATDFSEKRLVYWPTINKDQYRVIEAGETGALVREGTGPFYSQERYDWSTPGLVRSVVEESNILAPGCIWEYRVTPRDDGGSHVEVHVVRDFRGLRGALAWLGISLQGGRRYFEKSYQRTLDIIAAEADGVGSSR